jgi:hypothetical protein
MRKSVFLLAAVATLVLAGCAQPSVGDAKTQFCTDLKAVGTAVDGVKALTPTSTVEEAQTATKTLESSWTTLKTSAATLKEVQLQATEDAYNQIVGMMKGVSDQATLAQATTGVQTGVQAFQVAAKAINTTVCGVVAP